MMLRPTETSGESLMNLSLEESNDDESVEITAMEQQEQNHRSTANATANTNIVPKSRSTAIPTATTTAAAATTTKRHPRHNEYGYQKEEKKDSEPCYPPTLLTANSAPGIASMRSANPPPPSRVLSVDAGVSPALASSYADPSRCLTPEQVLIEARAELAKTTTIQRGNRLQQQQQAEHDERTQQILQSALEASRKRDAQMRSTRDVLKMAGKVLPHPQYHVTPADELLKIDSSTSSLSGPHKASLNDLQQPELQQQPFSPTSPIRGQPLLDSDQSTHATTIPRCLSPTSDCSVNSVEDFEKAVAGLPSKLSDPLHDSGLTREKMLNRIDGYEDQAESDANRRVLHDSQETEDDIIVVVSPTTSKAAAAAEKEGVGSTASTSASTTSFSYYLDYLLGGTTDGNPCNRANSVSPVEGIEQESVLASPPPDDDTAPAPAGSTFYQKSSLRAFSPLACGAIQTARDVVSDNIRDANSFMTSNTPINRTSTIGAVQEPPAYAETINARVVDPRMPKWMNDMATNKKNTANSDAAKLSEYFYALGKSRTVIVHEIVRGNWTWCTAWSPDGSRLAIATENHHLAVVDASASTVWRVRHDRRITNPIRNHTTHSIRSIAWGGQFIAIGGTGDAVSILSPIEPYPVVHIIRGTGFVGSLDWRLNSTVLAVGSRADKCSLFNISTAEDDIGGEVGTIRRIVSQELYTITRKDWVNVVAFSPGGSVLAVGDNSGKLSVYSFETSFSEAPKLEKITNFKFDAAILDVEWSPDGLWLYAGGEDFAMTIIETSNWQLKQRVPRDRWMHFVASSNRGTHVAVGGGKAQVTILDALDEWKPAITIELKGLVPLSAKWHPRDQYLAITGQDNSIVAIETTNARHIKGHYLQSISPIAEVEFSPDGQILAVGNEAGVVSFYRSDESSFTTAYEIVLADGSQQSIIWSPNGSYVMVGSGDTLAIIGQATVNEMNRKVVPPCTTGLAIQKVIRDIDPISSIAIHVSSRYAALVGESISILDAANDFHYVKRWENVGGAAMKACAWSPDGSWLATTGESGKMVLFDTSDPSVTCWKEFFTVDCEEAGNALAWGPSVVDGLQYLAYGGDNYTVTIIEIRTLEGTWETVLEVSRKGAINDLDWSDSGLLAVAVGDGTVTIIDLGYLKSGCAVNQMDYNWQRQGITCFTEIRRNQGKNSMSTIRWIPSQASEESVLAIGGSDGALEVIDLTERSRCRGFGNGSNFASSSNYAGNNNNHSNSAPYPQGRHPVA